MDSVDKLRGDDASLGDLERRLSAITGCGFIGDALNVIADEIESEIERDYMRLLVDVNNEPVHIGDEMEHRSKHETLDVVAVGNDSFFTGHWADDYVCCIEVSSEWHHVKPDTLKELLDDVSKGIICYPRERVTGYLEDNHSIGEAVMFDVRDRLRELMGGDAE